MRGVLRASRAMWCLAVALAARSATAVLVPCPEGGSRCQNGGNCLLDSNVGTYCSCPVGYEGTLCDVLSGTPRLPCAGAGLLVNYCLNGGVCPTTNSSYCDCTGSRRTRTATRSGVLCAVQALPCLALTPAPALQRRALRGAGHQMRRLAVVVLQRRRVHAHRHGHHAVPVRPLLGRRPLPEPAGPDRRVERHGLGARARHRGCPTLGGSAYRRRRTVPFQRCRLRLLQSAP
jgi:hypothetical protein